MIRLIAKDIFGNPIEVNLESSETIEINQPNLTLFPGLIDPHVHFRTPGYEHKEDWETAAKAAIYGGVTTVFDMPNTLPPTVTAELLHEKKQRIDSQLKAINIPLRYQLFFGADKNHLDQIRKVKNEIIGIKVFMGCSTGNLVIDDDESLSAVFEIAANENLMVAVHAEDEMRMRQRKKQIGDVTDYSIHSSIRDIEVATIAVQKAIQLTKQFGTHLYLLHVSTADEIELVRQAKLEHLPVFAETTPHHLFLNDSAYFNLKGQAVVNPPLRPAMHNENLFAAIHDNIIDTIGSDHAPHTLQEKQKPYAECPSGMPGIETTLPLLLNAHHQGLLTLKQIVRLTHENPMQIFNLAPNQDAVLVDLNLKKVVKNELLQTKCKWSAFAGKMLQGWPVCTILKGKIFNLLN